jgi:hypothetical protein
MTGMVKEFSADLYARFEAELEEQAGLSLKGVKRLTACLPLVRKCLELLRQEVLNVGFADAAAEVWFFKQEKPRFYRWLIYYQECYAIERGVPVVNGKDRLAYYAEQLRYLNRFFRQHEFHYQYYKLGATELDHLWFVRGVNRPHTFFSEVPDVDPAFGTPQDYLFSKFMAYEMLQEQVLEWMSEPADGNARQGVLSRKGTSVRWTADTCNLIELIYGLYETRQVNNGEVDLSDLMDVFEQVFQVNLSRYFHRFTEIKRRKTISKTKFLDQMREAVNQRIEDGDAVSVKKRVGPGRGSGRGSGSGSSDKMDFLKDNPYL